MTTKSPQDQTILVTGASGYVATHVLHAFLSAGYNVRGTVRSSKTAETVSQIHSAYTSQLTFSIVPDIRAPHAFDSAVQGVSGVIHTASPFELSVTDNEKDLLQPAIQGTISLLEAVATYAPEVRRVVITSSFAALFDLNKGLRPGYTYSEADWNPCTYAEAVAGNGAVAYCTSKVFAERAAFDFVRDKAPGFDIATINPPMIYGPVDHAKDLSRLNTSAADIWRFMNGRATEIGETSFPAFCDVRDVGLAHLRAYEVPEAGGKRFVTTGGTFVYQDVCDILREEFPELKGRVPAQEEGWTRPDMFELSNERATKVLGIRFRGLRESIVDTAKSLIVLEKESKQ